MKKKIFPIVVLVALIVAVVVPVYGQTGAPDPGAGRGNIFIQNIGTQPANFSLIFTRGVGIASNPTSFTYGVTGLPVGGAKSLLYTNCWQDSCSTTNVPDGWAGAVQIASTEPLASIVNLFWTGIPSAGTYSGFSAPDKTVYLPNLLKSGTRRTVVTVQNTDAAAANNVQMIYYNRNGTPVHTGTANIPGNSMQQFDLSTIAGVDFSATSGTGSLKITHPTNKLSAVASIHYPAGDRGTAVYGGFVAGSEIIWFPSQFRRYSGATATLYNANIVQNLGAQAANVTVFFLDKNNVNNRQCNDTIQPTASQGYNMISQGTAPAACWAAIQALGTNWVGTVKVVSNNAQKLAGVGFYFSTTNVKDVMAFEAIPNGDGSNKLYAPAVYRKLSGAASSQQWSATLIQNLESTPRTVTVKFYNTSGVQVGAVAGYDVPIGGNGSVGLNLNSGVNLPTQALTDLGTGYSGAMVVTAPTGSKLVGITNIFYEAPGSPAPAGSREQGSAYDAFPPR